jgi:hypothetical protein
VPNQIGHKHEGTFEHGDDDEFFGVLVGFIDFRAHFGNALLNLGFAKVDAQLVWLVNGG